LVGTPITIKLIQQQYHSLIAALIQRMSSVSQFTEYKKTGNSRKRSGEIRAVHLAAVIFLPVFRIRLIWI